MFELRVEVEIDDEFLPLVMEVEVEVVEQRVIEFDVEVLDTNE